MSSIALKGRTAAVLTASDRCSAGTQVDRSGPPLKHFLEAQGAQVLGPVISPDDPALIRHHLEQLTSAQVHLIVTTGGTGLSARDNTPEATLSVCDRLVPGLAEHMRRAGLEDTPFALLSRGVCGIAKSSLIINLPGNPKGALHSLQSIWHLLPHALDLISGETHHPEAPLPLAGNPQTGP